MSINWDKYDQEYAKDILVPFWGKGEICILPLPVMPSQGTGQCKKKCSCKWDIKVINFKHGDFDAYWILDPTKKRHCQTCEQRVEDWNPVQIRNWNLI